MRPTPSAALESRPGEHAEAGRPQANSRAGSPRGGGRPGTTAGPWPPRRATGGHLAGARVALALVLAAGAFGLAACDGEATGGLADTVGDTGPTVPVLTRVTTDLDRSTIGAGESVEVTCDAEDQYGEPIGVSTPLVVEVLAANGHTAGAEVTVDGLTVTVDHAGVYRVLCVFPGIPRIEDTSPRVLTVEAGPAVSVETRLFQTSLRAGEAVNVTCIVRDANGNTAAAESEVRVTPDHGVTVTNRRVRFVAAGTFDVVCALADGTLVGDDPVAVTVTPGNIRVLRTTLSADTIGPGEEIAVTCPGEDAFGNPVLLDKVFTLPVSGVDWLDDTRLRVTSTRSGSYQIVCAPREVWVTATGIPATFTVLPGDPHHLALDLSPDRLIYNVGARVLVTPRLHDAWGNPVPEAGEDLTLTVYRDGAFVGTLPPSERVDLDTEGIWNVSTGTGAPWHLSANRDLIADASAPSIEITYPARGAMVLSQGGTITIVGEVVDATGGLAEVRINGAPQPITHGQNVFAIQHPIPGMHGLNSIVVEALDASGNRSRTAQTFLVAPAWRAPAQRFDKGIIARLDKDFLDDGVRGPKLDDLVTIMGRVIDDFDVASYVPSPVVSYAGYDVYLQNIVYNGPFISLVPASGALYLKLKVEAVRIDVFADGFINVNGTVTASAIDIDMSLNAWVDAAGKPRVTAGHTVVDVQGFNINVHWSINWLISLFQSRVRDAITDSFEAVLADEIPPQIEDALSALALQETFSVPAFLPGMLPVNIELAANPVDLRLSTGGLELDLGTRASTLKRVPWSAPGSLMRGGCFGTEAEQVTWRPGHRLGFALSTDVLNQILFSVWWGGALEITAGAEAFGDVDLSEYGVADLSVVLSARMPPILTDCLDQSLNLQLGELHVDLSLEFAGLPLDVGMIMAFSAPADVTVSSDGELGVVIGEIDPLDVLIDIVSVDSVLFTLDHEEMLLELIRDQLLGNLIGALADQSLAGFPLPEIDLGGLSDSLAGQFIRIGDVTLNRTRGYVVLEGNP